MKTERVSTVTRQANVKTSDMLKSLPPRRKSNAHHIRGFVYFIGGDEGPIKIGFTQSPEKRLAEIQTSNSQKLRFLAISEGSMWLERYFHRAFEIDRLSGEWFSRSPRLMRTIAYSGSIVRGVG